MSELTAVPVDPRDASWEISDPAYRVYFWSRFGGGWKAREFEVSGGDVSDVVDWATQHAQADETYTMFALVDVGEARGIVRLAGIDPTHVPDESR